MKLSVCIVEDKYQLQIVRTLILNAVKYEGSRINPLIGV